MVLVISLIFSTIKNFRKYQKKKKVKHYHMGLCLVGAKKHRKERIITLKTLIYHLFLQKITPLFFSAKLDLDISNFYKLIP